jgi:hypothetical protein
MVVGGIGEGAVIPGVTAPGPTTGPQAKTNRCPRQGCLSPRRAMAAFVNASGLTWALRLDITPNAEGTVVWKIAAERSCAPRVELRLCGVCKVRDDHWEWESGSLEVVKYM